MWIVLWNRGLLSDILLLLYSVLTSGSGVRKVWRILHPVAHEWKGMGINRFCYPPKPPINRLFITAIFVMCISFGKLKYLDSIFTQYTKHLVFKGANCAHTELVTTTTKLKLKICANVNMLSNSSWFVLQGKLRT